LLLLVSGAEELGPNTASVGIQSAASANQTGARSRHAENGQLLGFTTGQLWPFPEFHRGFTGHPSKWQSLLQARASGPAHRPNDFRVLGSPTKQVRGQNRYKWPGFWLTTGQLWPFPEFHRGISSHPSKWQSCFRLEQVGRHIDQTISGYLAAPQNKYEVKTDINGRVFG
jgi:hypothetical protein